MKLVLNFPISAMNLTMETISVKGDTLLNVNIYDENKQYRLTTLSLNDVDAEPIKMSWGRGDVRLFKGIDKTGKSWFVFATQQPRRYYRIDADYETLKKDFNTSCNYYPQGKFLFNMDKSRKLLPGIVELYNIDPKSKFNESVYEHSILDLISDTVPGKLSQTFPVLSKVIPAKQSKGLFFTETQVYWLERSVDQMYNITRKFYGETAYEPKILEQMSVGNLGTPKLPVRGDSVVTLPHYNHQKTWISPVIPSNHVKLLLTKIREYESHSAVRVVLGVKTTRKTSGRYQINGVGTFGRVILDEASIASLKARLNGSSTLIMNGDDFTLLYTLSDVNALFIRGKVQETTKVKEPEVVVKETTPQNVEVIETVPVEEQIDQLDQPTNINVDPFMMQTLFGGKRMAALFTKQSTLLEKNKMYVDEYDYILNTKVLQRQFIDLELQHLSTNRLVLVNLPDPYGTLIAWTNVSAENLNIRFDIEDGEMVTFGAATFYRKGDVIIMADTSIILNTDTVEPIVPAEDRFMDALKDLAKEKSLADIINLVTKQFM